MNETAVQASLVAAGAPFGRPPAAAPALRWGLLLAELDGADDYALAVELIYEGYLHHYRECRACLTPCGDRQNALLAGDVFYARGLRLVAARGDAPGVGLLTRLMATCSYLRSVAAPFAADDALWAWTVGGLAAPRAAGDGGAGDGGAGTPEVGLARGRDGRLLPVAVRLFDEVDAALADGAGVDIATLARVAAPGLGLRDAAPLLQALDQLAPATVPLAAPRRLR